jgi:hypothetical protein
MNTMTERKQMDPNKIKEALEAIEKGDAAAALEILKGIIAGAAGAPEAPPEPAATETTSQTPEQKPEEMAAAATLASYRTQLAASNTELARLRSEVDRINAERAAVEAVERADLVARLVKCGAETPVTAWADPTTRKPVPRLCSESIESLRARVPAVEAAAMVRLPERPADTAVMLTAHEQGVADTIKDPAAKARFIAARIAIAEKRIQKGTN